MARAALCWRGWAHAVAVLIKEAAGQKHGWAAHRRIPNKQILEIAAWEHDRNANHTKADWQFTTKNARIKLKHLYPAEIVLDQNDGLGVGEMTSRSVGLA